MNDDQPFSKSVLRRFPSQGFLFVVAIVSLSASFFGEWLNHAPGVPSLAVFVDVFLKSAAYFALDGLGDFEDPSGIGNPIIRFARLLAVCFTILAAGMLLNSLFHWRDRLRLWLTSRRPHEIVIGLGWHGKQLLGCASINNQMELSWAQRQLRKCRLDWGSHTIAVDTNPDNLAHELCQRYGIPLLVDDARDLMVVQRLGLKNVKCVFIAAGNDDLNIEIAHALARSIAKDEKISIAVNLESPKSVQLLQDLLRADDIGADIELHVFNNVTSTLQRLFSDDRFVIDRFTEASPKDAHVVIFGDGVMAKEMLRHTLQTSIFEPECNVSIDVLRPDGMAFGKQWHEEMPCFEVHDVSNAPFLRCEPRDKVWLSEKVLPVIRFHDLPTSSRRITDWCESHVDIEKCITTLVVAMDTPSQTCEIVEAIGPKLAELAGDKTDFVQIWVYINSRSDSLRHSIKNTLERTYPNLGIRVFSDYLGKFDRKLATQEATDCVAKRVNALYAINGIEEKDEKAARSDIDSAWNKTDEKDKDSSRQAAVHAHVKNRIRKRLCRTKNTQVLESLARIEHRRWCAEYLLNGFTALTRNLPLAELDESEARKINRWFCKACKTAKKSFKNQKLHVDLVPYDDLPKLLGEDRGKKEQNKDAMLTKLDWLLTGKS